MKERSSAVIPAPMDWRSLCLREQLGPRERRCGKGQDEARQDERARIRCRKSPRRSCGRVARPERFRAGWTFIWRVLWATLGQSRGSQPRRRSGVCSKSPRKYG